MLLINENSTKFCRVTLYLVTFLNLLINSKSFSVDFGGFYVCVFSILMPFLSLFYYSCWDQYNVVSKRS